MVGDGEAFLSPHFGNAMGSEPLDEKEPRLTRRVLLEGAATALPAAGLLALARAAAGVAAPIGAGSNSMVEKGERRRTAPQGPHVAVVGAGAFGGWTALHLLGRGARVTLLDAWGPGNSRASSGGETRVIRHTYGPDRVYLDWVVRSLELWRDAGERWGQQLFRRTGMLWMVQEDDEYERAALAHLRGAGVRHAVLTPEEIAACWPQIRTRGIRWALWEEDAGYLLARRACEAVVEAVRRGGGEYRQAWVEPGPIKGGSMPQARLPDGSTLRADRFVFACGPWLGRVFPEVVGDLVQPTRQEVFYFGTPPGDTAHGEGGLPIWADHGERFWYGIPGSEGRGFKVADDSHGPEMDPTTAERRPSREGLRRARQYMEMRFPGLRGAPLLEARVCQYENSPDGNFLIDRHPEAANVWLLGGGSGHGYKHGPALGEYAASRVLGEAPPDPFFRLDRFASSSPGQTASYGRTAPEAQEARSPTSVRKP